MVPILLENRHHKHDTSLARLLPSAGNEVGTLPPAKPGGRSLNLPSRPLKRTAAKATLPHLFTSFIPHEAMATS